MRVVTDVRAVPHLRGGRIDLTWSLPPTLDFAVGRRLGGVVVVRRERTFPRDHSDGDPVYTGPPISAISDGGLAPQLTYYYTVYAREENETGPPDPIWLADQRSQASALATSDFGSTAKLYGLLPGVHQSRDLGPTQAELAQLAVDKPALAAALAALPPDIRGTGQLRRFVRAAAAPLDLMRSTAEALPQLHDVDRAPPDFLPLLARWLGWDVDTTLAVHEQRNEIKFAPYLYRKVGTIDSLRRLVTRYTGWYTSAAEMDQALLRSNQPPQLNLYATAENGAEWLGTDDASVVLGFGPANRSATGADGSPGTAAELVGSVAGPFALRPGMELTIAVDGRLPTTIRFAPGDFADMAAATADEVAAALRRTFTQLRPPPVPLPGGRLVLTSNLLGAASSLEVLAASASLLSLDGAPRGRLAAFVDASGRTRMFFAAADPLEPARTEAVRATLRGEQPVVGPVPGESAAPDPQRGRPPVVAGERATDRLYVKTWVAGQWQAARPVVELPPAPQSDPAAAALGPGILCAWVEEPGSPASKLRFAMGTPGVAQRARLSGRRSAPFVIEPEMRLVFGGRWRATEGVEFARSELPLPFGAQRLTAPQVVNLLAPHLVHVTASVGPRNTIVFSTIAASGAERLELDLETSTAAEALGFGPDNAAATGDRGDAIDWAPAADVAGLGPDRYADTFAVADAAAGVHLLWARHSASLWRIATARFDGAVWSTVTEIAADGAANREPCAVFDLPSPQLIWSQLDADGRWTLRRAALVGGVWGGQSALLPVADQPAAGTDGDREPSALTIDANHVRIFFRSDRSGGPQLWSTVLNTATGTADPPVRLTSGAAHCSSPAALAGPDGRAWLVHRSDANVPLARVGVDPVPQPLNRVTQPEPAPRFIVGAPRSGGAEELGARRRFAGSTSLYVRDAARFGRRRDWEDLIAYTPQRTVVDPRTMSDDDLYTRGTVGLYLSPTISDDPLTEPTVQRLRGALARFLPAPVRTVVVLKPNIDIEVVYAPSRDIGEAFVGDDFPFADSYAGAAETNVTAALPDWVVFHSAAPPAPPADHAADPTVLTTLRSRTWFPPPV